MNELNIKPLGFSKLDMGQVSLVLDSHIRNTIKTINWDAYPYLPDVKFAMSYDKEYLYIKFYVKEHHASAVTQCNNGPVCEDSCCEFFCSFDESGYYNLETNCVGAQLFGWHPVGASGQKASGEIIQSIQKFSSLGNEVPLSIKGNVEWQLVLCIPASAFFMHPGLWFGKGMSIRANFYKCGDKTDIPHFVAWNPIVSPKPDFHRPECFGLVRFL